MIRFLSLVALLVAGPLWAQEVPLKLDGKVETVTVKKVITTFIDEPHTVIQAFPVTIHAPAGAGLYFWTVPLGVTSIDKGDALDITAAPKGPLTISVKAISAKLDKDGKFLGFATTFGALTVDVGAVIPPAPPPVPPVPPPPVPPEPSDPFKKALFDAYQNDSGKDKLASLAGVFRFMAGEAALPTKSKIDELVMDMKAKRVKDVGDSLPGVRAVIGNELAAALPAVGYLNDATRQKCINTYNRIAAALEELK